MEQQLKVLILCMAHTSLLGCCCNLFLSILLPEDSSWSDRSATILETLCNGRIISLPLSARSDVDFAEDINVFLNLICSPLFLLLFEVSQGSYSH